MTDYRGGCVKGMPIRRDDLPSCAASCLHRAMVLEYRDARDAWEKDLEASSLLYDREVEDYRAEHPPPTFRAWLEGRAGERAAAEERDDVA